MWWEQGVTKPWRGCLVATSLVCEASLAKANTIEHNKEIQGKTSRFNIAPI